MYLDRTTTVSYRYAAGERTIRQQMPFNPVLRWAPQIDVSTTQPPAALKVNENVCHINSIMMSPTTSE